MEAIIFGIALSLTSATQTRIGGIGLGEVILSILALFSTIRFLAKKVCVDLFTKLFIFFFLSSFLLLTLGFISLSIMNIDRFLIGEDINRISINLIPLIFCIFTILIIVSSEKKNEFCEKSALSYAIFTIISQSMLWLYSLFVNNSLFGIILFDGRFQSWSANPNQLALIFLGVPFILFYFFQLKTTRVKKIATGALIVIGLFIGIQSASDALNLAWGFGLILLLSFNWLRNLRSNQSFSVFSKFFSTICFPALVVAGIITFGTLNLDRISDRLIEDANYGNQASDREILWANGIRAWAISPIFGLGPGAFSGLVEPFEGQESHNSFIEWLSNTGIFGLVLYLGIIAVVLKATLTNKSYVTFSMVASLCVFILFHYVLRQPVYWVYLVFAYYLSQGEKMEKKNVWDFRLQQS